MDKFNDTTDLRHTCLNCGKRKGNHKALTGNCPMKTKTRTSWVNYLEDQFFESDPKWKPPNNDFKI